MGSGIMNGHLHNKNGIRGRSYGLMLLLAFGIAISVVTVIHELKEKRIFNLVIQEKDRELIDLQNLLQEEREYGKEAKSKLEETKEKMQTLQTQKTDLEGTIFELQSKISSLKYEKGTINLALEEKQIEINQLRANAIHDKNENNQTKALSETLTHNEAKIEDPKQNLEVPVNVQSTANASIVEEPENLHGVGYMFRGRGKHGYVRKLPRKRSKILAKSIKSNEKSRKGGEESPPGTTLNTRVNVEDVKDVKHEGGYNSEKSHIFGERVIGLTKEAKEDVANYIEQMEKQATIDSQAKLDGKDKDQKSPENPETENAQETNEN